MSFILNFLKRLRSSKEKVTKLPNTEVGTKKPTKKYITTMINSITLSSDMETLHLIDNGRSISFPLNSKMGILVGTLNGQITVVSSHLGPEEMDATEGDGPTEEDTDTPTGLAKAATIPKLVRISTVNSQITSFYNKDIGVLGMIGASDIDFSLTQPERLKPIIQIFNLNTTVVNIRRKGNNLEIFSTKKS